MSKAPRAIGIILDGNRRWAKAKGLPTLEGHRVGYDNVKTIARAAFAEGVEYLTVYAFSTENWSRAPEEVSYLMQLLRRAIESEFDELSKEGVRIRFIGDIARLPGGMQGLAQSLEERTKGGAKGTLVVALSYGGRGEIVQAVNKLIQEGREVVSEQDIEHALWTHDIPDPDLIIRTSGEQRLSGFLTWQSVYSELFFTDTYWPDFSKEELLAIFEAYRKRERRHGK